MRSFLYAISSHTRYTTTQYLGETPIIPTGSVAAERKIIRMNHMVTLKMFTNHSNVEISVILKAVDGWYLHEIRNQYTKYIGITTTDLIDHLMDQYGEIMPIYIMDNKDRMEESIGTSRPIDVYFKHIDDSAKFLANVKSSYTNEQILQTVYHSMMTTGL